MKRFFLLLVFITSFSFAQDDQINLIFNGGVTQGEAEYYSSFAFGLEGNYLFDFFEDFKVGPSLGLIYFSGKTVEETKTESSMYLPLGVSAKFEAFGDEFFITGDVGYGIGLSPSGVGSGIYFKPMLGYNLSDNFKLGLSYSSVRKKTTETSFIGLNLIYAMGASGGGYYGGF